jgi:hypothetical protein
MAAEEPRNDRQRPVPRPTKRSSRHLGAAERVDQTFPNFRQAVESNIEAAGIAGDAYRIVEGPVEVTLLMGHHGDISILRLDTDHYSSTAIEMRVLFPKLTELGVLIVDDYGAYEGARRAVDEYLAEQKRPLMLTRVDRGVRTAVKT